MKNSAVADHIALRTYGKIYSFLYDNGYPTTLVDIGEKVINKDLRTLDRLQQALGDLIISDREYAAYAVWYYQYHKLKVLDMRAKDEDLIDYMEGVGRAA